ncbi:hypothetical protein [Caulobacter sp. LARHSG274]
MNYPDGQSVRIGDQVSLGEAPGLVVCSIDGEGYSEAFPESDWGYLGRGVIIDFPEFGLVHYVEPEPNLRLIGRARGQTEGA